ncbi:MAG: phenylacetate--CoA ligase family protein [Aliivibrio sp.]|uniref:hypothetical protein n=1 Tax=Aliivibrio sp. TaxID=1872443 RepID=UPI001A406DEC|nr:phenylacetate--CoA ligase family protein [Aliivibrio sp.]
MKDFLWWLLKENIFVNYIYRNILSRYFTPQSPNDNTSLQCNIIDKEWILKNSLKKPLFAVKGYTSGTTNQPLTVYRSFMSIILEEYLIKSYLKLMGAPLRPRIAIIRGDSICLSSQTQAPYWIKTAFTKRLVMSSFHISEHTAKSYFSALEEYQPHIIMAYPSSIVLLAKLAKKMDWKPNWELHGVLTSSEQFTDNNQEIARSIFGHIYDHYGQAERVAAFQQCNLGHYHVREDYSHVEFIQDDHGIKIVGSNIHNGAMPLKRYDTKDYVDGLCIDTVCDCGNTSTYVTKILGRDDDYILLPDGRHIGRLDVAFKGIHGLIESQIEQSALDTIIIRYVPEKDVDLLITEAAIETNLRVLLGIEQEFIFEIVARVPRTKAGKFRSVIRSKDIVCI